MLTTPLMTDERLPYLKVLAAMAAADGVVFDEHRTAIVQAAQTMALGDEAIRQIERVLEGAVVLDDVLAGVALSERSSVLLLRDAYRIVWADGVEERTETDALEQVVSALGVDGAKMSEVREWVLAELESAQRWQEILER